MKKFIIVLLFGLFTLCISNFVDMALYVPVSSEVAVSQLNGGNLEMINTSVISKSYQYIDVVLGSVYIIICLVIYKNEIVEVKNKLTKEIKDEEISN